MSNGNNGFQCCPSGLKFNTDVCVCDWPWRTSCTAAEFLAEDDPGCPDPCSEHGQDCKKADIVFVVDGSGSILTQNWPSMLKFIKDIIDRLPVDAANTHVGAMQFSNINEVEFHLTGDRNAADNFVDNHMIYQNGPQTKIAAALKFAREVMFNPANGARDPVADGITRLIFVITDGQQNPTNMAELTLQAQANHAAGFITYAIAVGNNPSQTELELIATDPDNKYIHKVTDFKDLEKLGMEFECN